MRVSLPQRGNGPSTAPRSSSGAPSPPATIGRAWAVARPFWAPKNPLTTCDSSQLLTHLGSLESDAVPGKLVGVRPRVCRQEGSGSPLQAQLTNFRTPGSETSPLGPVVSGRCADTFPPEEYPPPMNTQTLVAPQDWANQTPGVRGPDLGAECHWK